MPRLPVSRGAVIPFPASRVRPTRVPPAGGARIISLSARRQALGPEPPRMGWGKALPVLAVAGLFDLVGAFFSLFWFFGPALAGTVAGAWLSEYIPDVAAGIIGGAVAWATGIYAGWAFAIFGTIMALIINFVGVITIILVLFVLNPRIFKANMDAFLWFLGTFCIEEMPFVGAAPSITFTTARLYHKQIHAERAAHREWEKARKEDEQRERALRTAHIASQRSARLGAGRETDAPSDAEAAAA